MTMKKTKAHKVGGGIQGYQERAGSQSKKYSGSQALRYDSQKNLLSRLGSGEEPPKFSHANTTKHLFNPKASGFSTDFNDQVRGQASG